MTMAPSILRASNRRFEVNEMLSGKPSLPAASIAFGVADADKGAQVTGDDHIEGGASVDQVPSGGLPVPYAFAARSYPRHRSHRIRP